MSALDASSGEPTPTWRYKLPGVRAATTAPHEAFIAKAQQVLAADEGVLAAYLVGGFAVGLGDAFSDVDLQVLVSDAAADTLPNDWPDLINAITPTVRIQPFGMLNPRAPGGGSAGGLCITPEWLHFDVVFRLASQLAGPVPSGQRPDDRVVA